MNLLSLSNPARLLLLVSIITYGAELNISTPKPRTTGHIIVELTVETFWDAERVVVPIDRNRCVGGWISIGGSDSADNRSASYTMSVSEVRAHSAVMRMVVIINAGKTIEIKFSVIDGKVRQYEFGQSIKVRTYYAE
jgi:hypothetical protein